MIVSTAMSIILLINNNNLNYFFIILLLLYMKTGCRGYQSAALHRWASGRTDSATPRCFHPPDSCTSASTRASSSWDPAAPDRRICARELGWVTGPRCPTLRLIMRQNRRPTWRRSSQRRQRPAPQTASLHRTLRQTCQTPPLNATVFTTCTAGSHSGSEPHRGPVKRVRLTHLPVLLQLRPNGSKSKLCDYCKGPGRRAANKPELSNQNGLYKSIAFN